MESVTMCVEALVTAIQESTVYRDFEKVKVKLRDYPEIMQEINDFRRKNFLLQNSRNQVDLFHEIMNFQKEYEEFRKIPLVAEYTAAELGVCRMLQNINQEVMEAVDMEIDGFAEQMGL